MSTLDISLYMSALVRAHTSPVTTFQLGQGWESDYMAHQTACIKACSTLTSSHDGPANVDMACMHARSHEASLALRNIHLQIM